MTTLIEVRGGDGRLIGRCDARCYEAEHEHCECICCGQNHGTGLHRAAENTREMAEQWIAEYVERHGLDQYLATINHEATEQLSFAALLREVASVEL